MKNKQIMYITAAALIMLFIIQFVSGNNIQPLLVATNQTTFQQLFVQVRNITEELIYEEIFDITPPASSATVYLRNLNSTYDQIVNYSVLINDTADEDVWTLLENETEGYYGRGNVSEADLSGFVPYTGATADVDLGDFNLTTNGLDVTGTAQLGDDVTDFHGINTAPVAGTGLKQVFTGNTGYSNALTVNVEPGMYSSGAGIAMQNVVFREGNYRNTFVTISDAASRNYVTDSGVYNAATELSVTMKGLVNEVNFNGAITDLKTYTQIGLDNIVRDDLGTAVGSTRKYGLKNLVSGTSDFSYGTYNYVYQGNVNWALYNAAGNTFLGGDNIKTYWGTNQESSIMYDGSHLIINPQEVGTGQVNITGGLNSVSLNVGQVSHNFDVNETGFMSLVGDARVKREIIFKAQGASKGASAPTNALRGIGASGSVNVPVIQFSKVTQQDINGEFHLPDDIDEAENIEIHLMWIPGASWTSGNYVWRLEYLVKSEMDDITTGTPTTISMDVTPSNAVDMIETVFTSTIDADSEEIIFAHFYRDVAADDGDDVGEVFFFEVKYIVDSLGEPF